MANRKTEKKEKTLKEKLLVHTPFDMNLILCIVFLNIFGIVMIYSASYYYAENTYGYAPTYFFSNQIRWVIMGLAAMFVISFFKSRFYGWMWWLALAASFILVLAVRVPGIGHASHGAYRWIKIGSSTIQIAEPVKIFVIIFLAGFMTRNKIRETRNLVFVASYGIALAIALLFISNNMSTAIIVFLMIFFTVMMFHPNQRMFILLIVAAVAAVIAVVILIKWVIPYSEAENFRITRIRAWLDPTNEMFSDAEAYQATEALYAIGSGGLFGKGLGQSLIKFKLPEPHNDYILAIIFEEMGLFGVLLLTYLFIYLLYKIFRVYAASKDRYARILVLGVFLHLSIQILMNYCVTLGLFPTMGVTLPFISAGGSAAFFGLVELGVVLAVDRENKEALIYEEAEAELEAEDPYYKRIRDEERLRKRVRYGREE
ncbi:MAG: FtsW/RodA/SpoVE family cell cycle protein [Lachnospiraceae bacterium]|nr:FtsW/RodA/SpoVE family cell cycle protein [Lachnospiraceae bacterium]